jgi:hypothetical protein
MFSEFVLGFLSILCAAGSVQGDAYFPANSALVAGQALGDIASIVWETIKWRFIPRAGEHIRTSAAPC